MRNLATIRLHPRASRQANSRPVPVSHRRGHSIQHLRRLRKCGLRVATRHRGRYFRSKDIHRSRAFLLPNLMVVSFPPTWAAVISRSRSMPLVCFRLIQAILRNTSPRPSGCAVWRAVVPTLSRSYRIRHKSGWIRTRKSCHPSTTLFCATRLISTSREESRHERESHGMRYKIRSVPHV